MNEKILVFGGSFDPPHLGHRALLDAAREKIHPARVMAIPAYHSPWKQIPWASAEDRFQMAELAFPGAEISRIEMRARRRVYTVDVLSQLKKNNPHWEIHFVVGSDLALRFDDWKNPSQLRKLAHWWTAMRLPWTDKGKISSFFNLISKPMPEISSTELRESLLMGEEVSPKIDSKVLEFIFKRGLYGASMTPILRKTLKPERFVHTLSVARLARKLSPVWKVSSFEAALAGLLHDAGRSVPVAEMKSYCERRRLRIPLFREISTRQPILLHAYISEDLAKRKFKVANTNILKAIRHHTLGALNMGALERLIYVSDACSEDRNYSEAARLRNLAAENPEQAFLECLNGKIRHALSLKGWVHPLPVKIWNSMIL